MRPSLLPPELNGSQDREGKPLGRGAAQTDVSGPGQLLGKLTRLQEADPVKFREAVSSLAASLKDAAENDSGGGGRFLNELAKKLADVASGGDIAQLKPSMPSVAPAGLRQTLPPAAARSYRANSIAPSAATKDAEKQVLEKVLEQLQSALGSTASAA